MSENCWAASHAPSPSMPPARSGRRSRPRTRPRASSSCATSITTTLSDSASARNAAMTRTNGPAALTRSCRSSEDPGRRCPPAGRRQKRLFAQEGDRSRPHAGAEQHLPFRVALPLLGIPVDQGSEGGAQPRRHRWRAGLRSRPLAFRHRHGRHQSHAANQSLVTVFTLHLMGAIGNAGPYVEYSIEGPDYSPWEVGLFDPVLVARDGKIQIPEGPGWGVEIRKDWLDQAQYQNARSRNSAVNWPSRLRIPRRRHCGSGVAYDYRNNRHRLAQARGSDPRP